MRRRQWDGWEKAVGRWVVGAILAGVVAALGGPGWAAAGFGLLVVWAGR